MPTTTRAVWLSFRVERSTAQIEGISIATHPASSQVFFGWVHAGCVVRCVPGSPCVLRQLSDTGANGQGHERVASNVNPFRCSVPHSKHDIWMISVVRVA